jgi:T3SS negative regulator,GrlR
LVDGVYAAQFLSNANQYGEGIVVLDGGRIHGGDLDHVYIGNYSLVNNEFVATVDVANYSNTITSVFGELPQYRLTLKGILKTPIITA